MLVFDRYIDEAVTLETSDGPIKIVVCAVVGERRVKLGITAPKSVAIHRDDMKKAAPTQADAATTKDGGKR